MNSITVVVRKRDGVLFEGNVFAVSSTNEVGDFDVLPNHANFVCTIKDKLTIHHSQTSKKDFTLDSGVLRAKENKVEVYLGI